MQPLLSIAVKAARRAGDIIVRAIPRLEAVQVESKGRNDFVTEIDKAAEADIIQTIRRLYPDHAILAEESGASGNNEVVWIIDPLDGTTNFIHGFARRWRPVRRPQDSRQQADHARRFADRHRFPVPRRRALSRRISRDAQ